MNHEEVKCENTNCEILDCNNRHPRVTLETTNDVCISRFGLYKISCNRCEKTFRVHNKITQTESTCNDE